MILPQGNSIHDASSRQISDSIGCNPLRVEFDYAAKLILRPCETSLLYKEPLGNWTHYSETEIDDRDRTIESLAPYPRLIFTSEAFNFKIEESEFFLRRFLSKDNGMLLASNTNPFRMHSTWPSRFESWIRSDAPPPLRTLIICHLTTTRTWSMWSERRVYVCVKEEKPNSRLRVQSGDDSRNQVGGSGKEN